MSDFLVLASQQVEEQAIVWPPVDIVTLPQPPDVCEAELLQAALRCDVRFDSPGVHHVQPQLGESKREHLRRRLGRAPAVAFIAQYRPERGRLEVPIHVGQSHHADRHIPMIHRIGPEHVDAPLNHDLECYGSDHLDSVAEVQPLVVVRLSQPPRYELDQLRAVQRQQFHYWRTPPATGAGRICRWRSGGGFRTPSTGRAAWERATAWPDPSATRPG